MSTLLKPYKSHFSDDISHPIIGHNVQLQIKQDALPIRRSYNIPIRLQKQAILQLDKLQRNGIIEPVDRIDWATPLVTIKKKNGKLRLCLHLKHTLNKVSDIITYPLPKIADVFDRLHGARFT